MLAIPVLLRAMLRMGAGAKCISSVEKKKFEASGSCIELLQIFESRIPSSNRV